MNTRRTRWLRILGELPAGRRLMLSCASFLLPLLLWCAVSYVPFVWHPMVEVTASGDVSWLAPGERVEREAFETENESVLARGGKPATGVPRNPVFLPAPHEVLTALVTGFTTPPARPSEPWLHESLWHSVTIIFWGFLLSSLIAVPLGILCGALPAA